MLLEFGEVRLLTDPTFDPAGSLFEPNPNYSLKKLTDPALQPDQLGRIDVVLLSHDHHYDNLDRMGRKVLHHADRVLSTAKAAETLRGNCVGLANWESIDIPVASGRTLRITGTPARHGPKDHDRGPVTGFAVAYSDQPKRAVYISGDTVWFRGVIQVGTRFDIALALLNMGAAKVKEAGDSALTMTAAEAVVAAKLFDKALIIPMHYEGWSHFTESRKDIEKQFDAAKLSNRLVWPKPGIRTKLEF